MYRLLDVRLAHSVSLAVRQERRTVVLHRIPIRVIQEEPLALLNPQA